LTKGTKSRKTSGIAGKGSSVDSISRSITSCLLISSQSWRRNQNLNGITRRQNAQMAKLVSSKWQSHQKKPPRNSWPMHSNGRRHKTSWLKNMALCIHQHKGYQSPLYSSRNI
jgi:hypothetical protein